MFHGLYLGIIVIGALVIMIPNAPLLSILYLSQVVNGVLLPIVLIFMLVIINEKSVMEEHVNSRICNYITWATAIIMIGLSADLTAATFLRTTWDRRSSGSSGALLADVTKTIFLSRLVDEGARPRQFAHIHHARDHSRMPLREL